MDSGPLDWGRICGFGMRGWVAAVGAVLMPFGPRLSAVVACLAEHLDDGGVPDHRLLGHQARRLLLL